MLTITLANAPLKQVFEPRDSGRSRWLVARRAAECRDLHQCLDNGNRFCQPPITRRLRIESSKASAPERFGKARPRSVPVLPGSAQLRSRAHGRSGSKRESCSTQARRVACETNSTSAETSPPEFDSGFTRSVRPMRRSISVGNVKKRAGRAGSLRGLVISWALRWRHRAACFGLRDFDAVFEVSVRRDRR